MYRALFSDLDGTLFDDNKNISSENLEAINRIKNEGVLFTICSGRQIDFVKRINNELGKNDYFIASNGAIIYDNKNEEILFSSVMPDERCKYLIEYGKAHNFLVRVDTAYIRYLNDMSKSVSTEIELDEDTDIFLSKNEVIQITLCTEKREDLDEIIDYVENKTYDLSIANIFLSKFREYRLWAINILNKSASKGNAISGLCKYLKINTDEVVAIGDDLNDASMIKAVGMGVAMENAMPSVKEFAKYITTGNNESGVAKAINEFFV